MGVEEGGEAVTEEGGGLGQQGTHPRSPVWANGTPAQSGLRFLGGRGLPRGSWLRGPCIRIEHAKPGTSQESCKLESQLITPWAVEKLTVPNRLTCKSPYDHFTVREIEVQRGGVTCLISNRWPRREGV